MSQSVEQEEERRVHELYMNVEQQCKKFTDELYKELLVFFMTETQICEGGESMFLEFEELVKYYITRLKYPRTSSPKSFHWKRFMNALWSRYKIKDFS